MPLSSIQHEWLRAPFVHAALSDTGPRPDCDRYTLTMPSQSSALGPLAEAVSATDVVTNAAASIARPVIVADHRRAGRAESVTVAALDGMRSLRLASWMADGVVIGSGLPCIGWRHYVLERFCRSTESFLT